ncbi:MAG: transposase [Patescibacteria group bacterium]|nr:transposase [Patescibacteria group bacterium]
MELYHLLNHSIAGQTLFQKEIDYVRFVHNLYSFNDTRAADTNTGYFFKSRDLRNPYMERERELLVDIHAWCLMKDHYHLLLSERAEGGITTFIRKLNVGYANYVNEKYARSGTLFRGRTKKVLIERDAQYNYILYYAHLNPLDYLKGFEKWRVRDGMYIADAKAALRYLDTYRWSSHLDYMSKKNFPSLLADVPAFSTRDYAKNLQVYLSNTGSPAEVAFWLE